MLSKIKIKTYFMNNEFKWTDELVLMLVDLAHHNGYHKFPQRCVDLFDEVKKQASGSGYAFPNWITEHLKKSKEQLKPKEWQVLSLVADYGGHDNVEFNYNIATGFYVPELHQLSYGKPTWTLADVLNSENCKIKSVRRLNDGEIFTVGDSVSVNSKTSEGWDRNPVHKIYSFGLNDDKSMFVCLKTDTPVCGDIELGNRTNAYKSGVFDLNDFKKAKQPLFTTEDGKEIFEGQGYYYVNTAWYVGWLENNTLDKESEKPYRTYFSTREKANEYVLLFKPMLSVHDILRISTIHNDMFLQCTKQRLLELAKEKIK